MDGLEFVREHSDTLQTLKAENGLLSSGSQSIKLDAETRYRSSTGELYSVHALYLLLVHEKEQHPDYLLKAKELGVNHPVERVDRRDVLRHLHKKVVSTRIDSSVSVPLVGEATATSQPAAESNQGSQEPPKADRASAKRSAPSDTSAITKREKCYVTRNNILHSKTKSLESVLKIAQDVMLASKRTAATASAGPSQSYSRYDQQGQQEDAGDFIINTQATYMPGTILPEKSAEKKQRKKEEEPAKGRKRKARKPIIIVPAGMSALITLYNVQQFLESGKYVPAKQILQAGISKPAVAVVNRKVGNKTVSYRVVDSHMVLKPEDWDRVVAVFVQGPTWQFKGWPETVAGKKPVDLFSKYRAFHVCFKGEKPHVNVQNWDVVLLQLDKTQRHLDPTATYRFWDALDSWVASRFPDLAV